MVRLTTRNTVCSEHLWLLIYHQVTVPWVYFSKSKGSYEFLSDFFFCIEKWTINSVWPIPDIYSWTTCSQNCLNLSVLSPILPFSDQKEGRCHLSCGLWLSHLSPYFLHSSFTWEGAARNREEV